jgi:hypothetical protein
MPASTCARRASPACPTRRSPRGLPASQNADGPLRKRCAGAGLTRADSTSTSDRE